MANEQFKFPDEKGEVEVDVAAPGEVEVEIVDDTPVADRGRRPLERPVDDPSDDELATYSEKVQARIKDLTHARHDERRSREAIQREKDELERVAQHLVAENNQLKQSVNVGQQAFVQSSKEKAEADLVMARGKLKAAHEAFDTDAIVAAQEELGMAQLRAEQVRNFRPTPLQPDERAVQTRPEPQAPAPDEKSLRWQAKNQWFGQRGFEEYTSFALGLHQKLVTSGIDARSDTYFDQINDRMKSKFPELFGEADKPRAGEGSKKPPTVVASASRSTSAGKVRLTATQVALAKKFGLTPQQYAVQVAKLENQNG